MVPRCEPARSVATKAPAEAARLSIVVLPFANLSGDPAQDYFVDALTEDLTTECRALRDSFVIARNTAFTYKGKPVDAKAIGKELGVRYVLEGSVQPSGDRMRVNAQLIDAGSGASLWTDGLDPPRADLLQTSGGDFANCAPNGRSVEAKAAEGTHVGRAPAAIARRLRDLALPVRPGHAEGRMIGLAA